MFRCMKCDEMKQDKDGVWSIYKRHTCKVCKACGTEIFANSTELTRARILKLKIVKDVKCI